MARTQTDKMMSMEDKDMQESMELFLRQTKWFTSKIKMLYYIKHTRERVSPYRMMNLAKYYTNYCSAGRSMNDCFHNIKKKHCIPIREIFIDELDKLFEFGIISDTQYLLLHNFWRYIFKCIDKYYFIYKFL